MKKLLLIFAFFMASTMLARAQIVYHDIKPDTSISTWDVFQVLPIDNTNYFEIWWHPAPEVVVTTWGSCELLFDVWGNYPAKLDAGSNIDSTGKWKDAGYLSLSGAGTGNWRNNADNKYLAFRVRNNAGSWKYGWLKMSVASGASGFTVSEWAYHSSAKSIKAGESGTAGIVRTTAGNKTNAIINGREIRFTNLDRDTKYQVNISSITGQSVCTSLLALQGTFELPDLAVGIYVVHLVSSEKEYSFKLAVR